MTSLEAAIASINNALLNLTAPSTVAADCLLAQATGALAEDPSRLKATTGKSAQAAAVAMPYPIPNILCYVTLDNSLHSRCQLLAGASDRCPGGGPLTA